MFLFNSDGSTFNSDKEGDGFKYLLSINTTGVCHGRESATLLNINTTSVCHGRESATLLNSSITICSP
jgi:hypothetical protein